MKKSRYFIFTFLFSISLFSCSHQKDGGEETSDLYTIKSLVSQIENEAVWSVELEKERLTKTVKQEADFIPEGHTLTTENAKLSASLNPAVYPVFKDFASLNLSNIEYKYVENSEKLCRLLADWDQEKLFGAFPSNYRFNYIFFAEELQKGWKDNFGKKFPSSDEKTLLLFNRWILGQPARFDNLIQFPVRFYCNSGYVDVTLYMSPDKENTLYNIKIERWERYE